MSKDLINDKLASIGEDVKKVGATPDELTAAKWSAEADFQLRSISGSASEAKKYVGHVESYCQECIDDMHFAVNECKRELCRTLDLYKRGVYNGQSDYESAGEPEQLRGDGPRTTEARDAARANRVANRPVMKWLGAAVLSVGSAVAGAYGFGEYAKAIPPLPPVVAPVAPVAPPVTPPVVLKSKPELTSLDLQIGEGTIVLSSTEPVVMNDQGNLEHYVNAMGAGKVILPAGTYTFMIGWGEGFPLTRGHITVKADQENTLKVDQPKKQGKQERSTSWQR